MQIGDENVHRVAVLLDESVRCRKPGGHHHMAPEQECPSSKLLGETASYLLWYAKDKNSVKYNALYEQRDRQAAYG